MGLKLQNDKDLLSEIKESYSNDDTKCCKALFQLWLIKKGHNVTWNQLIEDLRIIDEDVASKIETKLLPKLLPMEDTVAIKDTAGIHSLIFIYLSYVLAILLHTNVAIMNHNSGS